MGNVSELLKRDAVDYLYLCRISADTKEAVIDAIVNNNARDVLVNRNDARREVLSNLNILARIAQTDEDPETVWCNFGAMMEFGDWHLLDYEIRRELLDGAASDILARLKEKEANRVTREDILKMSDNEIYWYAYVMDWEDMGRQYDDEETAHGLLDDDIDSVKCWLLDYLDCPEVFDDLKGYDSVSYRGYWFSMDRAMNNSFLILIDDVEHWFETFRDFVEFIDQIEEGNDEAED